LIDKKIAYSDRFPVTVYKWGQVTFVPHFSKPGVYVGPGYPLHTKTEWSPQSLVAVGARPEKAFLWCRPRIPASA